MDNCAKAILDDLAVRMKNDPKLRANVIGYTDGSKLETGKKGLGEKRAKAVAAYLEKQGVETSRMTITDGGANNPVGDNKDRCRTHSQPPRRNRAFSSIVLPCS